MVAAPSTACPVGVPSGSRTQYWAPGSGSGVSLLMPAAFIAAVLNQESWASAENRYIGRSPVISSSHSRRGERSSNESGIQACPRSGASAGWVATQSRMAARTASRPTIPATFTPSLLTAIEARWLCESMNPGRHIRPWRSISSVPASMKASAPSRVPTWTRSVPRTTIACAQGCAGSPVQIGPLVSR